jgi:hypothetical protein
MRLADLTVSGSTYLIQAVDQPAMDVNPQGWLWPFAADGMLARVCRGPREARRLDATPTGIALSPIRLLSSYIDKQDVARREEHLRAETGGRRAVRFPRHPLRAQPDGFTNSKGHRICRLERI